MSEARKEARESYVVGVGMTAFGRHEGRSVEDLGEEAVRAAIADARIDPADVEIAFCGHVFQGITAGQRVLARAGLDGPPIINVENACASGSTAFFQAVAAVRSGLAKVALAVGFEKMERGAIQADPRDVRMAEPQGGSPLMPGMFAEVFRAHSRRYGTTLEQLAMVSVKNRDNAVANPKAQYRKPVTVDEVLHARPVADPLTLLMCCPTGSGAAAAVVTSADVARGRHKPIAVAASVLRSERAAPANDPLHMIVDINTEAATKAYEQASVRPDQLDVIELHDCFAIAEIIHYENLGLCPRGEGGRFIEAGQSRIGGKVAVSTSGGLLSKGHPLGATGVAQVVEAVEQLRGESGPRQVGGARLALTHCQGFGGAVAVHIFSA
jgi:acetyl-CoA acetyltransferase